MAIQAQGTTISGGVGGCILSFSGTLLSNPGIDVTCLDDTEIRKMIPASLDEGGELSIEIQYSTIPTVGVSTNFVITFSDGSAISFEGYVSSFAIAGEINGLVTGTTVIKVQDAITETDASGNTVP
jgi:hypothetical protein